MVKQKGIRKKDLFSLPEDSEKEVKDNVSKLEQPFLLFPVEQIEDLGDIYQVLSFRVTEQYIKPNGYQYINI